MALISYADRWKKLWSIRFAILSAAFSAITTAYLALPGDWLPLIPGWLKACFAGGAMSSAVASSIARVIRQDLPPAPDKPA